jgi:myo-inositol-1(or 4)-monophosphatase
VIGTPAADLAFAIAIARASGRIVMDRYERLERISHKGAKDVVTEADHESEAALIAAIRARFPDDGIFAEESGPHDGRHTGPPTDGRGRTWVLDPLDGTINYANGIPYFAVSIGLVVDGRPSVGVVLDPTRDELFAATVDGPATLDGRPIEPSSKEKLSDCVIALGLSGSRVASRVRGARKAVRVTRSMGSSALSLAYVANGRFDAFAQQAGQSAWDVAAAGLIAERAGALVTDFTGGRWFDIARPSGRWGVVAAPAQVHGPLIALIGSEPETGPAPAPRMGHDRPVTAGHGSA